MNKKKEKTHVRKDNYLKVNHRKHHNLKEKFIFDKLKQDYDVTRTVKLRPKTVTTTINSNNDKLSYFAYNWLNLTLQNWKPSTYAKYRNILTNHIIPELGAVSVVGLDTETLSLFCHRKLTNDKLSPKTVKDILSVIKAVCKYAESMGYICTCDFRSIHIRFVKKNTCVLNKCQVNKIKNYLIENINHVNIGILISLCTGIRIGELCALKYDDLDMETMILRINKTMQRIQTFSDIKNKTSVVVTAPKSECSVREIPISSQITKIILENNMYKRGSYILTGDEKRYVEPRTLENKFYKIASCCDIKNISFHIIRHTFATMCVEAGVDIKTLSEILGHSSVNVTLNRYVHSSMESKKNNMKKMYSYLF